MSRKNRIDTPRAVNEDYEKKISARTQHLDIEKIIDVVCEHLGLNPALLNSPSKQSHITRARAIISSIAFDTLRLKGADIAQWLNLTPTAISKFSAKGRTDRSAIDISRSILTI